MDNTARTGFTRRAFLGGSVAAGGLALTGCGGSSGTGTNTLRVGIPGPIQLTSLQRFQAQNQPVRRTVFDYLIDKNADGGYSPALATKWEWDKPKTRLTLTLRDGVTYHTGRTFGPDDVVASIETALDEKSGAQAATLLKRANGVKKTGKSEVTVTFDEPFVAYLDALAMLPMIDEKTYANVGKGEQVVGTGPFSWKSWKAGSEIELARHGSYWGGKPAFAKVVFSVISDSQAMLAAMRSGDLELVNRMIPRDAATLKTDDAYTVDATAGFDVYVGTNVTVKPLDDVRVRQAVAYALDRDRIAEQVYKGFADASCVPWTKNTPGVSQDQRTHYTYDVDKGKALLDEAGAAGAEVALTSYPADPAYGAIQDIVQYGLKKIGLKVKPVTYDAAQFSQHMQAHDFPGLWVAPVALTTMGPATALLTANPLTPDGNTPNFTEARYGKLVEQTASAATEDEQATAISTLTDYMLDQAFHNTVVQATTPIVSTDTLRGVSTDLTLAVKLAKAKSTA